MLQGSGGHVMSNVSVQPLVSLLLSSDSQGGGPAKTRGMSGGWAGVPSTGLNLVLDPPLDDLPLVSRRFECQEIGSLLSKEFVEKLHVLPGAA